MKKLNLLSKAEMKNVMGGTVDTGGPGSPGGVACAAECTTDGASCTRGNQAGRCTFYQKSKECPDGEYACII